MFKTFKNRCPHCGEMLWFYRRGKKGIFSCPYCKQEVFPAFKSKKDEILFGVNIYFLIIIFLVASYFYEDFVPLALREIPLFHSIYILLIGSLSLFLLFFPATRRIVYKKEK